MNKQFISTLLNSQAFDSFNLVLNQLVIMLDGFGRQLVLRINLWMC